MNNELEEIPDRILKLAIGALAQANTHATYSDPGKDYWDYYCVINAAHAGELFIKAIIALEHPLLIFKDIFSLNENSAENLNINDLVSRGRTHDFERLPQVLWVSTGIRLPNQTCYDRVRKARNAIQHFCVPDKEDFRSLSLEFIYTIIDPLIHQIFGLFAIQYHEDHSVDYDYVVASLLRQGLKFSIPEDFDLTEISVKDAIKNSGEAYKNWLRNQLKRINKDKLINF